MCSQTFLTSKNSLPFTIMINSNSASEITDSFFDDLKCMERLTRSGICLIRNIERIENFINKALEQYHKRNDTVMIAEFQRWKRSKDEYLSFVDEMAHRVVNYLDNA